MRASARPAALPSDLRRRLTLFGSIGLVAAALVFGYATAQPEQTMHISPSLKRGAGPWRVSPKTRWESWQGRRRCHRRL
jgi:hypothetical protein